MPRSLPTPIPVVVALLAVAGACGTPPDPPRDAPAALASPAADGPDEVRADPPGPDEAAHELTLTLPAGVLPDGTEGAVVIRSVAAGDRREVVVETPAGVVDHHVVTADQHWWWIPPAAREAGIAAEWVRIDVAAVERAGGELPDLVADARVPLPAPGDVRAGTDLAGREVLDVEHVGPDEDRLHLAGLERPAVLRRRALPPGTRIEPPQRATSLQDLPDAVRWSA